MKRFPIIVLSALLLALAGCANSPFRKQPEAASDVSPQALMALQESAEAAYAAGNAPAATTLYTQLVQHAPNDVQAWRRLGSLELLDGQHTRALYAYEHALQLGGADATVWRNIAVIRVGQAQQALAQAQSQPGAQQQAIRADSARAAQVLEQVFPRQSAPASAASIATNPGGEQP